MTGKAIFPSITTDRTLDRLDSGILESELAPRMKKRFLLMHADQLMSWVDKGCTYPQVALLVRDHFGIDVSADWMKKILSALKKARKTEDPRKPNVTNRAVMSEEPSCAVPTSMATNTGWADQPLDIPPLRRPGR